MRNLSILLSVVVLFCSNWSIAQKSKGYLPDKPGTWKYDYNMQAKTASEIQFKKNNTELAEWFHQHIPVLTQPK